MNYLEQTDTNLYNLIRHLCLGKMLVPRRNSPGITFLRPDKALFGKINQLVESQPEEAANILRSMVLLDYLETLDDFEDKKSDIPTLLRKKLPIASVSDTKITLTNGAEITKDKDFQHRDDRNNIAVYIISKEFVPMDTENSTFSNVQKSSKSKKVKGGAEFQNTKKELFEAILALHTNPAVMKERNPAAEVLVSLCDFLSPPDENTTMPDQEQSGGSEYQNLYTLVLSQLSYDTLASLAIILQPYRASSENIYITADVYNAWKPRASSPAIDYYSYHPDPIEQYKNYMHKATIMFSNVYPMIKSEIDMISSSASKVDIIKHLRQSYHRLSNSGQFGNYRTATFRLGKLALAESELRVFSAILHESSKGCLDKDEANRLYKQQCTLDMPYIVGDKDQIAMSNIGFYFSTAYLIARSDGLCYVPGIHLLGSLDHIADEYYLIKLDQKLKLPFMQLSNKYRNRTQEKIQLLTQALNKLKGNQS